MADSDVAANPAVEAGTASNVASWGALRQTQPGAEGSGALPGQVQRLGKSRMVRAIQSRHITVTGADPGSATRPSTMVFIREVLIAWRATERELAQLPEGSSDRPRVQALLEGLRSTYHRIFAESRGGRPGS